MEKPHFIPAIGTPLVDGSEALHVEGMASHLQDLSKHGITTIFSAGSMGAMPLLRDETYRQLIDHSVDLWKGRGRLLVGAGDTSFARTRDRIEYLNQHEVQGVVVLAPFFWTFDQAPLTDYFAELARFSRAPLFLYDLPQVTKTKIELQTVLKLAEMPNIAGIKCSDEPSYARELTDRLGESFEVIIAQPNLVDTFLRHGMHRHLDGMYALAPQWVTAIGACAQRGDWSTAATIQQKLTALRGCIVRYDLPGFTTIMNARGIPGMFAPRPYQKLNTDQVHALLNEPVVRQLLEDQ